MKKLICALVLLAMLVPVAAMAAVPQFASSLDLTNLGNDISFYVSSSNERINSARYQRMIHDNETNTTYTANYFLTGAFDYVNINFAGSCHCNVSFGAGGVMREDSKRNPECKINHTWPAVANMSTNNTPDENVLDVAKRYGYTGNDVYDFLEAIRNKSGSASGNGKQLISADDGFAVSFSGGRKMFVHYGPIVYSPVTGWLRVYGDKDKSIFSWADYNVDTGELDHYGMFTEDGSVETVYDAKNRLISTEIWTADGGYWNYKNDKWAFSASGDPEGDDLVFSPDVKPNDEVLTKIALSPRAAAFPVAAVNSISNVSADDKGTPVVIGSVDAETEAKMLDNHTSEYEMKVSGDGKLNETISLLLPYGAGQNQEIAEQFTYTVEHKAASGTDNYSTEPTKASEMTMTFTENGVLISGVSSFSPFTVTWGPKQASTTGMDSLPSTGDSSNLLAYACLLLASAAMFVMLRRRAHQ